MRRKPMTPPGANRIRFGGGEKGSGTPKSAFRLKSFLPQAWYEPQTVEWRVGRTFFTTLPEQSSRVSSRWVGAGSKSCCVSKKDNVNATENSGSSDRGSVSATGR